jgi:Nickel responsive protein SCO4226-like
MLRHVPLFIDIHHKVEGLSTEAITVAHHQDLAVQARFGVRFIRYWYDEATGKVFCLSEAPDREAISAAHRAAHGLAADEIVEVREGA